MTSTAGTPTGRIPKLALAGHAFSAYEPGWLLSFLRRLGLVGLDYWPWNRGGMTALEFRALADDHGVDVFCVNVPSSVARVADPAATDEAHGAIVEAMEEAVVLGASFVQVYSAVPYARDARQAGVELAATMTPLLAEAAARGLVLVVENNLDQRREDFRRLNPSRSPQGLLAAVQHAASDNFRICYDPCNFITVGVEEYPYAYDLLSAYIVNVHAKDCRTYASELHANMPEAAKLLVDMHGGPFLPTPFGCGAVAWRQICGRLAADGYHGWLTLDPFIHDSLLIEWCEDAVRELRAMMRGQAGRR